MTNQSQQMIKVRDLTSGTIHTLPASTPVYEIPDGFDREVGAIDVLPGNQIYLLGEWAEKHADAPVMVESGDPSEDQDGCVLAWISEVLTTSEEDRTESTLHEIQVRWDETVAESHGWLVHTPDGLWVAPHPDHYHLEQDADQDELDEMVRATLVWEHAARASDPELAQYRAVKQ